MRRILIVLLLICCTVISVSAMEFTAPAAPESAEKYMPDEQETFAQGLLFIIKTAIKELKPELAEVSSVCIPVIALSLLMGILNSITQENKTVFRLISAVSIGVILLNPVNSMVQLGANTVTELTEYGKLFLPVMTAAMAAQGGVTSSAALYTGTVFFNALLSSVIVKLIIPGVYIYLCLCIANNAFPQEMLKKMKDFLKWAITWGLKWILYIFCGYISITGVISGTVDASALKATKLTISGTVPVVGGILSDASETILLSAGLMKSSAGIYGIFTILAVCVRPFVEIGAIYLLLKLTGAVCSVFADKTSTELVQNFTTGMGFVLAMTGTVCILLLVSIVCFMKGMS